MGRNQCTARVGRGGQKIKGRGWRYESRTKLVKLKSKKLKGGRKCLHIKLKYMSIFLLKDVFLFLTV